MNLIQCPDCKNPIDTITNDHNKNMSECSNCGIWMSAEEKADTLPSSKPNGIEIKKEADHLILSYRLLSNKGKLLYIFILPIFAFVSAGVSYGMFLRTILHPTQIDSWVILLFSFGTTYLFASLFLQYILNRKQIVINNEKIILSEGPIPTPRWGKKNEYPTQTIKHFYAYTDSDNEAPDTFSLKALTHEGEKLDLLNQLPTQEQAIFLLQTIDSYLRELKANEMKPHTPEHM